MTSGYRVSPRVGGGIIIIEPGGRRIELAASWSEALLSEVERVDRRDQPAFLAGVFIMAGAFVAALHEFVNGAPEPSCGPKGRPAAPPPKDAA